jgi:uroporphyrinogen-III synthase
MRDAKAKRPSIALLECRMKSELARLVEKHGGLPVCVPALREAPIEENADTAVVLDELSNGVHDVVVFMTGAAISVLFELAEQRGRRTDLVLALRRATTVCRGPKPSAALKGFGVTPNLEAREPFTAAELIDVLSDIDVTGRRILLFNYGERSETLAETLLARRAVVRELWLYRWQLPHDTSELEALVRRIALGDDIDALALTCQIQFRHLYQIAERLELERALLRALNGRIVVAAVGPTTRAILDAYGVEPRVMPKHPKMGPLVIALMKHLSGDRTHHVGWRLGTV